MSPMTVSAENLDIGSNKVHDPKITICHFPPGNEENPQTIEISQSAWDAHEAHGDYLGECVVPPEEEECSLEDSLFVNGSFEEPEVTNDTLWQKMSSVPDWTIAKVSDNTTTTLELHRGWSGNVAADGLQYAELDGDESTRIYQNINTEEGAEYKLFWSFAPRHDIGAEQNNLSVEVGGSQVASNGPTTGTAPLAQEDWESSSYVFVADSNSTEIAFEDIGPSDSFGTFVDNVRLCKTADPIENPPEPYFTIKAHKIVCDNESYLPNWGDGSGPSQITATTAIDYVNEMDGPCWLEDDWSFQWGIGVNAMPGDYLGYAEDGWLNFNTDSDEAIPAEVQVYRNDGTVKVREVLPLESELEYIPFSYTPGDGTPPGDNVSAELYCSTDILNYDNYDFISNPQFGQTYYCVAFNALASGYAAYCGDGVVNQDWEQCDSGSQLELSTSNTEGGGGGSVVGCSEQCQFVVPPQQCSDLTLAKIHVDEVLNWQGGDMTGDVFLGSESNVIPSEVWFPLYWNGNYYLDSDLSNYEDVEGFAVQRLQDSLRVVMHGTGAQGDKEHVDGHIEFYNATVGNLTSDNSNSYPNSNQLENGFDGTGVELYNAGNDEVWTADDNMSHYWLTTTTADDGYYTDWQIVEDCSGSSICGVKFHDTDKDGTQQSQLEENLSDWTINLYEKYSCSEGDEWADSVVSYTPGPNVPAERSNPNKALGVAENNDTINFVSLGVGGELVLAFDNFIENKAGDDIEIIETSYNNPSCASYPEYVHVYASQDGNTWTDLGTACQEGDPSFDLGSLPWAKYVKLLDNSSNTADGFDVDGVRAINCLNAGQEALATTTTTEKGYCFSNIEPGDYMVCEEMQEGWTNSTPLCQQVSVNDTDNHEAIVDFGNYETTDPSTPYAPWCSALLGIVRGAIESQIYNDVADLNDDEVVDLIDVAMIAQLYAEGDDDTCYAQFEDPEDEFHWSCENLTDVDWCGGLYQGVKDSLGSSEGDENYFFVYDLNNDHGDGTYGDGVINLSDVSVMAQLLAEPVNQYDCYEHYPFFSCEQPPQNTPPVITLTGDATVYINQGDTYVDAGATANDNEDGDLTDDIVTDNPVDTSTPGTYVVTYNVTDSNGAPADEVTRIVIVQSQGGGDPICGNNIVEAGEECDGSAPEGYQCTENCTLVQNQTPPPSTPSGGGGGGGGIWPPRISNLGDDAQCQATTISWNTSELVPSWIVYGTDENNLDQEYKNDEVTRNHSVALEGLLPDTTYYYEVRAENRYGIGKDGDNSFTTPPAEICGEVLGEKIEETAPDPSICDFVRPSGSIGADKDVSNVFTYPDGSLIRYECDHSMGVYALINQMKYHIPNLEYLRNHYFGKRIYNVSWQVFNQYPDYTPDGQIAGIKQYADGTLLRGSDHRVYVIINGRKVHIKTLEELMKYAGQEIVSVSDEVLAQY